MSKGQTNAWDFVLNLPNGELDFDTWFNDNHPSEVFAGDFIYLCFQLEQGTNLHMQGYIVFTTRKRLATLKKAYGDQYSFRPRIGSHSQMKHYCSKPHNGPNDKNHSCEILQCHLQNIPCGCKHCEKERVEHTVIPKTFEEWGDDSTIPEGQGDRSDLKAIKELVDDKGKRAREEIQEHYFGDWVRYGKAINGYMNEVQHRKAIAKQLVKSNNIVLRAWQQYVVDLLDAQDDRKVIWVVDEVGSAGKTELAKWLKVKRDAVVFGNDRLIDMTYKYDYQDYIVFHFVRADAFDVPYKLIEDFKDCCVFSSKYECVDKMVEKTHVLIMSNFHPQIEKLSQDRWHIIELFDSTRNNSTTNDTLVERFDPNHTTELDEIED